ncbi:unnamed protein product [Strongylus vulgaris]|uniref:Uncharacterized protein n=1 Tax=Strongylus vulgaris TaxID=40348 RepID=A0A3P7J6H6_STRVU|nr:unnamed protein product [Strongylus vulgaris]
MMIRSLQQQTVKTGIRVVSTTAPVLTDRDKNVDLSDPKQMALHKLYRPERVTPSKRGVELLKTPRLNKVS